jgi:PiT family inorganic phosphate transporter
MRAFAIITLGAFAGPLIAGTAVASTMGHGIVDYRQAGAVPLEGGILGGIGSLLAAYAFRIPTTASVGLVSAMVGSLWASHEQQLILWPGVIKVGYSLIGSIVVGWLAGACAYVLGWIVLARVNFKTGARIMKLQNLTVAAQALGYGANDAEKMMGLMAAGILLGSRDSGFSVPLWIIAVSIAAFAAGMAIGGIRVAKTIGGKIFRIRPLHALSFQLAAATTVLSAAAFGGPLSTTQTTASAILGVGAAASPRRVHWQVATAMVAAWFLTVPVGLACGVVATLALRFLARGL